MHFNAVIQLSFKIEILFISTMQSLLTTNIHKDG